MFDQHRRLVMMREGMGGHYFSNRLIVLLVSSLSAVGKSIKYMYLHVWVPQYDEPGNWMHGCTKAPAPLLVVKHLNLEGKILFNCTAKCTKITD